MKKCLIAGNDPQYVTGLGKEEHIKKLKALLKKYIQRLICCGFTEFCADAESEVAGAAAEALGDFGKACRAGGWDSFNALVAVWGSADGGLLERVRRAADNGMPLVIIDAETLSVTSFKI